MLPHYKNKHASQSLITPDRYLEYQRQIGLYPEMKPPKTVILTYQKRFSSHILRELPYTECDGCFSTLYFLDDYPGVAVIDLGTGAPKAAAKLEQLIAWGVSEFYSIGFAGSLQRDVTLGDIVLCDRAIRDEGTSHHYTEYDKYAHSCPHLLKTLEEKIDGPVHKGASWTVDTFYRQTKEEVEHYQNEGVLTVEMEAAALYAVAAYHNVSLTCAFTISDELATLDWKPNFHDEKPLKGLETLLFAITA